MIDINAAPHDRGAVPQKKRIMARLVVNPDSEAAWEIQLNRGENLIGRGFANDFQITDASISGSHCQITINDDSIEIKDLGSTNGTFVDGAPVCEAKLQNGQRVRLGSVEMIFYSEGTVSGTKESLPSKPTVRMVTAATRQAGTTPMGPRSTATLPGLPTQMPMPKPARAFPSSQFAINQPRPAFFRVVWGAFGFPFRGDGVVLLIAGTVFLSVLNLGSFIGGFAPLMGFMAVAILGVLGNGYLVCYLRSIVAATAIGENKMPDWPDISDVSSDIIVPFLQLLGTLVACALPLLAVSMLANPDSPMTPWLMGGAVAFGALYFPMAFLAVAMLDTIFAVNPLAVMPPIARMPLPYLFVCLLFGLFLVFCVGGGMFLPKVMPIPIIPQILLAFVQLYFLTVSMRVLGLLYWTDKEKFGWIGH